MKTKDVTFAEEETVVEVVEVVAVMEIETVIAAAG
jgi:hypothetical protein